LCSTTCVALTTSAGALFSTIKSLSSYNAGAFAPSTIAIFSVPLKLYLAKRTLDAPSLLIEINVITASSAGLLASAGSIASVAAPLVTTASAVTVYTRSIPAILNTSPACGIPVMPSTTRLVPVWLHHLQVVRHSHRHLSL
jgi:hypothetical protein